ncbi:MAG: lipase maturation factor family protein [Burkholderiales bacterium]
MSRRPIVVYDGDCAFCEYWARYWERLAEGRLSLAPYQQAARDYPQIQVEEFKRAVQYIALDGKVASAAEASFLALSLARGRRFWLWLYRHVPGFAALSERIYAFIAARRSTFHRLTVALWGREPEPSRYAAISFLFLRVLGLIYLAAFVSFGVQAEGLIGSQGILPFDEYLERIYERFGAQSYFRYPTFFWLNASDLALTLVCWSGAAVSLLLIFNWFSRTSLAVLFTLYLSIFTVGQVFTIYQWDLLLLETGFVAILLTTGSLIAVFLMRWLLFRVMFLSGVVKLASGDAAWTGFNALAHYFETQPLPAFFSWYAHQAPEFTLVAAVIATFVIELALAFLIFAPRRLRFIAVWAIIVLQILILLTGNYGFFNLLVLALTLFLFDDRAIGKLARFRLPQKRPGHIATAVLIAYAAIVLVVSGGQIYAAFIRSKELYPAALANLVAPLRIVNTYGAFAEIVTERNEIVIEGSNDRREWREYGFKYKPGELTRAPSWNIPHQPRLDWQMWFAAIGNESRDWFPNFLNRLLQGSPDVLAMLEENPFAEAPPKFIRAMLYQYRFTTPEEKRASWQWWERQQTGIYYPQVSLRRVEQQEPSQAPPLFESLTRPQE